MDAWGSALSGQNGSHVVMRRGKQECVVPFASTGQGGPSQVSVPGSGRRSVSSLRFFDSATIMAALSGISSWSGVVVKGLSPFQRLSYPLGS